MEKSEKPVRANSQMPSQTDVPVELLADGVMVLDKKLKVIAFSEGAERITGYSREEATGKSCQELFRSEMCAGECPAKTTLKTGQVLSNSRYQIFTKDDDEIPICVSTAPLRDKQGKVVGVVETFRNLAEVRDLTARLSQVNREVLREKDKLSAIMNSITDGAFTVNQEFRITSFNKSAERISGFKAKEAIGKECHRIFRSSICQGECPLKKTLRTGEAVTNYELEIFNKQNKPVPISVNAALLRDENGEVVGGVETFRDLSQLKSLTEELKGRYSFGNIIGKSNEMRTIYNLINDVAPTNTTVLLEGETGTGKELVAHSLHYNSPRREGPFIVVNAAALPDSLLESELFGHVRGAFTGAVSDRKGRFEAADSGTIFLDEIADISSALQAKLLRVLENREFERVGDTKTKKVDIRFIAATNQVLEEKVAKKEFREDLYYRLNVVAIRLPPLRERREDIPLLVNHFVTEFNRTMEKHVKRISPEAMDVLLDHPWPGNVRQLENAIEHAFVHCRGDTVLPQHLPAELQTIGRTILETASLGQKPLDSLEEELLRTILEKTKWNHGEAARLLGISRTTLWRRMKKYGIPKG